MKKNELLQLSQMLARVGNMMATPGSQMDANTQALIQSAQAGIQQEALKKAEKQQEKKRKGGLFGQIGGALGGLAMAPLTGGMSLPMAMAAMGGGTALGNVTGQALSTGKVDTGDALLSGGLSAMGTGASRLIGNMVQSRMGTVPQEGGAMPAFRRSGGAVVAPPIPTEVPPGEMANLPVEPAMTPQQQQQLLAPIPPQGYWGRMGQHLLDTGLEPISGITDAMAQYYAGKSTMPRLGASDVMGLTPEQAMNVTHTAQSNALMMKEDMQREKDRAMQIKVEKQKLQNERDMMELKDQYAEMAEMRKQTGRLEELEVKEQYAEAADLRKQTYKLEELGARDQYAEAADQRRQTGKMEELGVRQRNALELARQRQAAGAGAGGRSTKAPDVRKINGVDHQWNPETQEWIPFPMPEAKEKPTTPSARPQTGTITGPDGTTFEVMQAPNLLNGKGGYRAVGGRYGEMMDIYSYWSNLPKDVQNKPAAAYHALQWGLDNGRIDPKGAETFMQSMYGAEQKSGWGSKTKTPTLSVENVPPIGPPQIEGFDVVGITYEGNYIVRVDGQWNPETQEWIPFPVPVEKELDMTR